MEMSNFVMLFFLLLAGNSNDKNILQPLCVFSLQGFIFFSLGDPSGLVCCFNLDYNAFSM